MRWVLDGAPKSRPCQTKCTNLTEVDFGLNEDILIRRGAENIVNWINCFRHYNALRHGLAGWYAMHNLVALSNICPFVWIIPIILRFATKTCCAIVPPRWTQNNIRKQNKAQGITPLEVLWTQLLLCPFKWMRQNQQQQHACSDMVWTECSCMHWVKLCLGGNSTFVCWNKATLLLCGGF